MNPLFAHLALDWLEAERLANPAEWPAERLTQIKDEMTVAVDRVYEVISGNVKWEDASPGDKAVWKSRVTSVPMFARSWRRNGEARTEDPEKRAEVERLLEDPIRVRTSDGIARQRAETPRLGGGPRLHGVRERLWWVIYDTVRFDPSGRSDGNCVRSGSIRMFGNANIGNVFLTNMQVPGQMPGDSSFTLNCIYASVSSLEALHWAADNVTVDFIIGERRSMPTLFIRDLFRGVDLLQPGRFPLIIPVRQRYSATVTCRKEVPAEIPPFDMTLHLEGLLTRDIQ
jgi:hypothetical protein